MLKTEFDYISRNLLYVLLECTESLALKATGHAMLQFIFGDSE